MKPTTKPPSACWSVNPSLATGGAKAQQAEQALLRLGHRVLLDGCGDTHSRTLLRTYGRASPMRDTRSRKLQLGQGAAAIGEPLAIGVELHLFAGTSFAVAAVGISVDLAGAGAEVDDRRAVAAVEVSVQLPVDGGTADGESLGDLARACAPEPYISCAWPSCRYDDAAGRPPTRPQVGAATVPSTSLSTITSQVELGQGRAKVSSSFTARGVNERAVRWPAMCGRNRSSWPWSACSERCRRAGAWEESYN